ncbi:uncharacterized protein V6R79_014485 [Siganus canaliculatus]
MLLLQPRRYDHWPPTGCSLLEASLSEVLNQPVRCVKAAAAAEDEDEDEEDFMNQPPPLRTTCPQTNALTLYALVVRKRMSCLPLMVTLTHGILNT